MKWFVLQPNCHICSLNSWDTESSTVLLPAITPGCLSAVVLPTFLCPAEFVLNCTPAFPVSYSELHFVLFLAWSNQMMLKNTKLTHTLPLWSSPLFLWDLRSSCYYCLHFFFVFLGVCIYYQYIHISAVCMLSMQPIAAWKIKPPLVLQLAEQMSCYQLPFPGQAV